MKSFLLTAFAASALAVGSAQANLFIANGTNLSLYTNSGTLLTNFATDLSNPQGVAEDPSGNVYVSDLGNNTIRMYNSSGTFVRNVMTSAYSGTGTPQPFALTWNGNTNKLTASVSSSGGLYGSHIVDFDVSGTNISSGATDVGGNYEGLAYNNTVIYAAVGANIQWFSTNPNAHAGTLAYAGVAGSAFKGFAYNAGADRKIVADFGAGLVTQVGWNDPVNIATGLNQPMGVIYNSSLNQVIVTEFGAGKVNFYNFTTNNLDSSFSLAPGLAPSYLAYTSNAIPEPATWALLALGLTVVVTLRRRRSA